MDAKPEPIYSTCDEDPELREAINEFVIGLAEAVDALQDAEATGDLGLLADLGEKLAARSLRFGYEPMAQMARQAAQAGRNQKPEVARDALEELTDLAHRVRLGHRGAA